jgi:hypothetical protein
LRAVASSHTKRLTLLLFSKGAKAYFLRRILHDFSDTFATKILSQIVPAMSHDSRILIADLMFPSEHITPEDLSIATFDITMFNMGGKERSEADFRLLLDNVGCELVKVWRSENGLGVIVEGKLKGSGEMAVEGPVDDTTNSVDAPNTAATVAAATETQPPALASEPVRSLPAADENGLPSATVDHGDLNGAAAAPVQYGAPVTTTTAEVSISHHNGDTNGHSNGLALNEPTSTGAEGQFGGENGANGFQ